MWYVYGYIFQLHAHFGNLCIGHYAALPNMVATHRTITCYWRVLDHHAININFRFLVSHYHSLAQHQSCLYRVIFKKLFFASVDIHYLFMIISNQFIALHPQSHLIFKIHKSYRFRKFTKIQGYLTRNAYMWSFRRFANITSSLGLMLRSLTAYGICEKRVELSVTKHCLHVISRAITFKCRMYKAQQIKLSYMPAV